MYLHNAGTMGIRCHWVSMSVTPFCMLQIAFCLPDADFAFLLDMYVTLSPQCSSALQNRMKSVTDYYCFRVWGFREWRVWTASGVCTRLVVSWVLRSEHPLYYTTLGPAFRLPSVSHRCRLTRNIDNNNWPLSPCAAGCGSAVVHLI